MKKYAVIIVSLISILNVYPNNTIAKEYTLSADCKEKTEQRYNQFLDSVFDDVLNTYHYLNKKKDDENVFYYTMEDLSHVIALIGESNESIDSLSQFFVGGSIGERRLYFFNWGPNFSYLLYKDTSHNNVMVKIKRVDGKWVEVGRKVKNGKVIELDQPKCN